MEVKRYQEQITVLVKGIEKEIEETTRRMGFRKKT